MSNCATANSISLSAPGGGEGRGEVGDSRALADAHLTLPAAPPRAPPSPPEGRRGVSRLHPSLTAPGAFCYPGSPVSGVSPALLMPCTAQASSLSEVSPLIPTEPTI